MPDVTYVDTDRRAARYFDDPARVIAELQGRTTYTDPPIVRFLHADYTHRLPVEPASVDLLVSLFAGPGPSTATPTCGRADSSWPTPATGTRGSRRSASHFRLVAAVQHRADRYRLETGDLDGHLDPAAAREVDARRCRAADAVWPRSGRRSPTSSSTGSPRPTRADVT